MNIIYSVFVTLVWFFSTYFAVTLLIVLLTCRDKIYKNPSLKENDTRVKVSLLVPVFNEGKNVIHTIDSLKKVDYPKDKLEIIILNDGSSDNTSDVVNANIDRENMIFVDNKENKGKAATLNQGIDLATGELVATMDGDTEVPSDVVEKTVPFFKDEKVGACTVSVEVKNPETFLQKIIEIEYTIGLSLALKALSFFNAVHVTPGPFSMYRLSVLKRIGCFDVNNITEDHEIAIRIHKAGFKIENCTDTKVQTISPGTFKTLYRQRKRWYTGSLLTLWQHKDIIMNKKLGTLGFIYPYSYLLITGGLLLFILSVYLGVSNFVRRVSMYSLTNYNFFSHFSLSRIDLLELSTLSILGGAGIITTFIAATICLKIASKRLKTRVPGFIGYIFLFFLYQIFWGSSFVSAITRRKVKWR